MDKLAIIEFLKRHKLAVQASVGEAGAPQAAVVGIAVSDRLEVIFDTLTSSRKFANLRADPRIALVIGWDAAKSVQLEGIADFPGGSELARIQECYFEAYPDGRDRLAWPGIIHVRVCARWLRYSDFTVDPPYIVHLEGKDL